MKKNTFKKNKIAIIFIVILSLGFFLRAFKFNDWMHYQLDQARDFRIIHSAIKYGVGELPLQGPKAAGNVMIKSKGSDIADDKTTLRLGPLFYYMEYVSALIFGDTPVGSIVLILIFSFLTIPLFYIFVREFFNQKISLALMTIFSVSIFFVTYSRFGWNPNLMPFFMLAFVYSLLQATSKNKNCLGRTLNFFRQFKIIVESDCCKNKFTRFVAKSLNIIEKKVESVSNHFQNNPKKQNGWWLMVVSISLAFLSNMHFLAFTIAPVVAVVYLIWTRPQIALKYWLGAIAIFIFLNIPLIINDIKTDGENYKAFISAVLKKSDKKILDPETGKEINKHSLFEKFVRNGGEHTQYNWLILTGDQRAELPQISDKDIKCDQDCKDGFFRGIISFVILLLGLISGVYLYWKEKKDERKNFLIIILLWLGINFMAYIPLSYDLAPRFFLLSGPLVLVLWGMVLKVVSQSKNKYLRIIIWLITAGFIISNLIFVFLYFNELSQAKSNPDLRIKTDHILKEKNRMTLEQMEEIVEYMVSKYEENNYPIFLDAQAEFKRAFWERIDVRDIPRDHISGDLKPLYREGNYFIIIRTQSNAKNYLEKFVVGMDVVEKKVFGTLTLYELKPKGEFITDDRKVFKPKDRDPKFSSSAQVRYLWRQIFE
ncbi:MAG: glycosyltransferase family 39 protein [Candidatus Moranbacteria bacterium]|nr:glycosyltransferase family 39 protein [Candidatus Moranbacteria bacterium]